jgi:hypothetical protein
MLFPTELGTLAGWITATGVVGIFGVVLKFLPEWVKARTAEKVSDDKIARVLRDELFDKLNECEKNHKEMTHDYGVLAELYKDQERRVLLLELGDQRKTVAITLLMNEVSRLDPTSDIILRAKAVLELSIDLTLPKVFKSRLDELDKK